MQQKGPAIGGAFFVASNDRLEPLVETQEFCETKNMALRHPLQLLIDLSEIQCNSHHVF